MKISKPVNKVQERYNDLCGLGGGKPERTSVQALLKEGGLILNKMGHDEITKHLSTFPDRNPWHICFAMGLCWGHLAKDEGTFIDAATRVLSELNTPDLKTASSYHFERGPLPVEQSLRGGYLLFQKVTLPETLPNTLHNFSRAHERWISPLIGKASTRPKYIGSWNATAMFMIGIFSKPELWPKFKSGIVNLPPNGPVYRAMHILYSGGVSDKPPVGTEFDESSYDPTAIYLNNAIIAELIDDESDLNMIDLHSGLYMLGTRYPHSKNWVV